MAHDLKVSEATGSVLDWMVGYARSLEATNGKPILARDLMNAALRNGMASPSTDWAQGGPIIEREMRDHGFDVWRTESMTECAASYTRGVLSEYVFGPTPLIAAMRCYVASKLGDIVKVPKEMNHGA